MSNHGPTPGSRCTVCRHPRAIEADEMLRRGKSVASVARLLGLARRDAVDRHIKSGHVAPVTPGVAPAGQGGAMVAGPNATPVGMLRTALEDLRAMDISRMSHAAQTMRLDAIRRSAESLGKLEPTPRANAMSVEDFLNAEDGAMRKVIASLFRHIEPYPEVRTAVLEDLVAAGLVERTPTREEIAEIQREKDARATISEGKEDTSEDQDQ